MTSAIASLILVTTGAFFCTGLSACSESEHPRQQRAEKAADRDKHAPEVTPQKAPTALPDMEPRTLTAIAPTAAPSIADATSELKSAAEAKVAVEAFHHDEPAERDAVNYDRPLDPSEVKIKRFVLAKDVKGREPIDESDTFSTDVKTIFAFVQLDNADGKPYAVRVHWEPLDGPATPYGAKLEVATAPRFRTWSWTRIQRAPGHYKAVLKTLEGEEIAYREFTIEQASD